MAKKIDISREDFGILCVCALRYCHGRKTYMPGMVQDIVRSHFEEIEDKQIKIMLNDCEFQRNMDLYGDETIDKPGWLNWEGILKEEAGKRGIDV